MYFDMWNLFSLAAILNFAVSWWKASNLEKFWVWGQIQYSLKTFRRSNHLLSSRAFCIDEFCCSYVQQILLFLINRFRQMLQIKINEFFISQVIFISSFNGQLLQREISFAQDRNVFVFIMISPALLAKFEIANEQETS